MGKLAASVACLFVLRQFEDVEIARIFWPFDAELATGAASKETRADR
jgi:hypothetical protein